MDVKIFKSKKYGTKYFIIPAGADQSILPEEVTLKKSIELKEGEKRIALDNSEVIRGITEKGFYETNAEIIFLKK